MTPTIEEEIEIFCCYAPQDHAFYLQLAKQLGGLIRRYHLNLWENSKTRAGDSMDRVTNEHINSAHLFVLLVSPDFVDSDYCQEVTVRAKERKKAGEVQVIPVLLRNCLLEDTELEGLLMLPKGNLPIAGWSNQDNAFTQVAGEIARAVKDIRGSYSVKRGRTANHAAPGKIGPSVLPEITRKETPARENAPSQAPGRRGHARWPGKRVLVTLSLLAAIIIAGIVAMTSFSGYLTSMMPHASPTPVGVKTIEVSPMSSPPVTPSPTATATPVQSANNSPSPTPSAYYSPDWTNGFAGWNHSSQWSLSTTDVGALNADGSKGNDWIVPPASVALPQNNYTVSAQIRFISYQAGSTQGRAFGLLVRQKPVTGQTGYVFGFGLQAGKHAFIAHTTFSGSQPEISGDLKHSPSFPDTNWHTYRIDVYGTTITAWMDGQQIISTDNAVSPGGGQVGVYDSSIHLLVKNFAILPLAAN